jgi:hypothetical protein
VPEFSSYELALSWSARLGKGYFRALELRQRFTLFRLQETIQRPAKHPAPRIVQKSAMGWKKSVLESFDRRLRHANAIQ